LAMKITMRRWVQKQHAEKTLLSAFLYLELRVEYLSLSGFFEFFEVTSKVVEDYWTNDFLGSNLLIWIFLNGPFYIQQRSVSQTFLLRAKFTIKIVSRSKKKF
jgi:hypothetical protein